MKAVEKEMRQLHDRGVMIPVQKESLTLEQRKEALAYLMFLKRKRCGKVKGRGCADGRKQRAYIAKEEATAPTVSTEAVFLTAIIDALEGREVAVLDVPGAFMQADIDELVHVKFTGEMVNMLLHIDHDKYKDNVVTEREDKVLYMELLKALYGTLRAARLFWEKLSKQVKGRGCADGRKQRSYIAKEEATAPTVSTEAVFLTAIIDALEGREVAVLDVPGAFMQADIDELVHVKFTGEMVNMLLHIDHDKYKDYVVTEREDKVLYMELLKALYGTLRAARLFWEKLSKQLVEVWGFTPNKYDDCVVNKTINGQQMTVVWHVDDLKVSHADKKEVDKFIAQMEAEFGTEAPLSISCGKVHDYLGMNLDFRTEGEVRIDMEHYIDMMLHDAPEDMDGVSTTPAPAHLFKTNSVDPKSYWMTRKRSCSCTW